MFAAIWAWGRAARSPEDPVILNTEGVLGEVPSCHWHRCLNRGKGPLGASDTGVSTSSFAPASALEPRRGHQGPPAGSARFSGVSFDSEGPREGRLRGQSHFGGRACGPRVLGPRTWVSCSHISEVDRFSLFALIWHFMHQATLSHTVLLHLPLEGDPLFLWVFF